MKYTLSIYKNNETSCYQTGPKISFINNCFEINGQELSQEYFKSIKEATKRMKEVAKIFKNNREEIGWQWIYINIRETDSINYRANNELDFVTI